jgi:hypothetical protein
MATITWSHRMNTSAWGTADVDAVRYGPGMSEEQIEHGELTERFRVFAQSVDPEPSRNPRNALLAGGAIVLLVALVAIVVLVVG